jgi:hypothetical protein
MAKRKSPADDVQNHMPGTHEKVPAIHDAAVAMLAATRKSKRAKKAEEATREDVRAAMEEYGQDEYEYGGLHVKIDTKRQPKVKMAGKQPESEE